MLYFYACTQTISLSDINVIKKKATLVKLPDVSSSISNLTYVHLCLQQAKSGLRSSDAYDPCDMVTDHVNRNTEASLNL